MKKLTLAIALMLLAWAMAVAAPSAVTSKPAAPAATGNKAPWEMYAPLMARNIFVKDRTTSRPVYTFSRPAYVPSYTPSEPSIALTGVVRQDAMFIAIFENTSSGESLRARAGDRVGKYSIVSISLDSVESRKDGTTRTVRMGETLSGALAMLSSPAASATSGPSATVTPSPVTVTPSFTPSTFTPSGGGGGTSGGGSSGGSSGGGRRGFRNNNN